MSEIDEMGYVKIEAKEVQPLEIEFGESLKAGYLLNDEILKPLPIGSTLNSEIGVFSWHPGPGFIGDYPFVFITRTNMKIKIRIRILPRFKGMS